MSQPGRVAVVRRFGPPDVISIENHASPALRPDQVRVAVRTGGLNPVDARRRSGSFGGQVPMLLGTEFAGIVVESQSQAWTPGDEVIGWGANGADADLMVTTAHQLHAKPADLGWALAGGLSGVGQSALTALNSLDLAPGDTILLHGAAGGVGTVLTQLAVRRGLSVLGTASAANQAHLRDLGATPVVYGDGLAGRVTAAAGGAQIAASIDLAGSADAGDLATQIVAAGGAAITLVPETMMSHDIPLVRVQHSSAQLAELLGAIADGTLILPVETMPFTEIVEAHRRLDAKHATGKLVLDLADNPHLPLATQ
ncbi:NADP-dependent oxidoreductase [Gordonia mangrovi]|nr:NADP-dependent oxidoreductase [Gordonia mangrovi]UVF80052.1 NADP-dependent oxidoreductase [Gordonia mangrovi]